MLFFPYLLHNFEFPLFSCKRGKLAKGIKNGENKKLSDCQSLERSIELPKRQEQMS